MNLKGVMMKTLMKNKLKDPMEFDTDPESNIRALNINMGKEIPQDYNPEEAEYGDKEKSDKDKDKDNDKKNESPLTVKRNSFIDNILMKLGF